MKMKDEMISTLQTIDRHHCISRLHVSEAEDSNKIASSYLSQHMPSKNATIDVILLLHAHALND